MVRPLPTEMVYYARQDTRYLIYLYQTLKVGLYIIHFARANYEFFMILEKILPLDRNERERKVEKGRIKGGKGREKKEKKERDKGRGAKI